MNDITLKTFEAIKINLKTYETDFKLSHISFTPYRIKAWSQEELVTISILQRALDISFYENKNSYTRRVNSSQDQSLITLSKLNITVQRRSGITRHLPPIILRTNFD
jgi:hypothetical protein